MKVARYGSQKPVRMSRGKKGKRGRQPEGKLKKAILDYLALRGVCAVPIQTKGTWDPVRKCFIRLPKGMRGTADIWACKTIVEQIPFYCLDGEIEMRETRTCQTVWIECKRPGKGGVQSDAQKDFQARVEAAVYLSACP